MADENRNLLSKLSIEELLMHRDLEAETVDPEIAKAADKTFDARIPGHIKLLLIISVVAIFVVSFMLGKYPISPFELFSTIIDRIIYEIQYIYVLAVYNITGAMPQDLSTMSLSEVNNNVVFKIRLPRILIVMLVGAALAVAGASYQGMFKNPLTSPDLLGASSGASLGACLAILLDLPGEYIQLFAFLGGMLAVALVMWLNGYVNYDPILGLVLAGILVSTLFNSGVSLIKLLADSDDKLPQITFWLMGSFAQVNDVDLLRSILPMIIGFMLLLSQSWRLNVLSFGDEEARSMGINTSLTRFVVIFAATLITSVSVAIAGIVGWIGLVVPHLARALVGPNYKVLLPTSMFVGAVFLLIVDNFARLLGSMEIPIGILTSILGVPFFIFIFRHNMRGW